MAAIPITTDADEPRQAVLGPGGPVPPRPAHSIRRTSTIDMTWPDGDASTQQRLDGRARDAVTIDPATAPIVVAEASVSAGATRMRVIEDISADPRLDGLDQLVGCRGGGHLRTAIETALPGLRESGHPLYLLLDDLAGGTLIGGFVWTRFGLVVEARTPELAASMRSVMEGVCIGFAPGSSALGEGPAMGVHRIAQVVPLIHPDDPHGWHPLADLPEVSMRRARWIDVTVEREGDENGVGDGPDGTILVSAGFQDSAGDPVLGRIAVHEYRLRATADLATATLTSVEADPHVLPFMECPSAPGNLSRLIGTPLAELRSVVLERLSRTAGCTHLNDAMRALAEVPTLVDQRARHLVTSSNHDGV